MLIVIAMFLAQADPAASAAVQPVADDMSAAAGTATASAAAPPVDRVCRTRFKTGQGLIGSMKQVKVCKTKAEWAAIGNRSS